MGDYQGVDSFESKVIKSEGFGIRFDFDYYYCDFG